MTLRVGLIGIGFMGRMHLSGYQKLKNAKVVAIADIDPVIRSGKSSGAGNLGDTGFKFDINSFEDVYASGFDLIKNPTIDIVDICVPTVDHKDLFVAACKAGKNVLVEKPIARKPADVDAMIKAAKNADGFTMVAQCIRFWPAYAVLKDYVTKGTLGKCRSAIFRRQGANSLWSEWYKKDAISGAALYDLHVHDVDYVNYLFGKPNAVASVGSAGQTSDKGVDHVVTNYYYPKTVVDAVTSIGAWSQHATWPFYMGFTVVFDKGTLDFNGAKLMLYKNKDSKEIKTSPETGWFEEVKYFVNCVAKGVAPAINPMESTAITMKIVQAEEKAVKSGKVERV